MRHIISPDSVELMVEPQDVGRIFRVAAPGWYGGMWALEVEKLVEKQEAAFTPPHEPTFLELALADIEETGNNGVQDILVASYLQAKIIQFLINGLLVKLTEIVADSYRVRVWG